VDQGLIDIDVLRDGLAGDERLAWVRAVAGPEVSGKRRLLFAQVTIGPQPEGWHSTNLLYEQCVFMSGSMAVSEFTELLRTDVELRLSLASILGAWSNAEIARSPSLDQ
jgi:hypothetical protein